MSKANDYFDKCNNKLCKSKGQYIGICHCQATKCHYYYTLDAYSYTRLISTRAPSLKNTKSGFIFFRIGVLFSPKQSQRKESSYAG